MYHPIRYPIFTYTGLLGVALAGQPSVEMELIQNLTANYDVNARPVANAATTVPVEIGIALQQIVDLVYHTCLFNLRFYVIVRCIVLNLEEIMINNALSETNNGRCPQHKNSFR